MKILPLILTLIYITSCNLKTQRPSFADNISLSDTICLQEIEKAKQELAAKGFPDSPMEDVLSYVLFPEVALQFFEKRKTSK